MTFKDCLTQRGESKTSALLAARVCGCAACRYFAHNQAQDVNNCYQRVRFERAWQAWRKIQSRTA